MYNTMDLTLIREAVQVQTSFALNFSTHLITSHENYSPDGSNIAFSPLSVHLLLSLLIVGSTGATQQQLLSLLSSSSASDLTALYSQISNFVLVDGSTTGGPRLRYANGVWVDKGTKLKDSFREVVASVYKAEANAVRFRSKPEECRKQINKWVEKKTAGHIKDLIPPPLITVYTRVVLGNAIYFKGSWPQHAKFDPRDTKTDKFYSTDGISSTEIPFMSSTMKRFVSAYNGFKVLKLPYEQGRDWRQFSFYIFLPDTFNGLHDLSKKLSTEHDFLNRHIPMRSVPVRNFRIPKFKISMGIYLRETLTSLGLVLPFQMTGDFSAMVNTSEVDDYYVSEMIQKCFVEVNEEGTKAAAATALVMMYGSSSRPLIEEPVDFVADHPFLFLLREDRTGVVLFMGHLLNPSEFHLDT